MTKFLEACQVMQQVKKIKEVIKSVCLYLLMQPPTKLHNEKAETALKVFV